MGKWACCRAEESKSRKNAIRREGFEAKSPIVSSSPINQDKSVAKATNRKTIAEGNVHMNGVQEVVAGAIEEFAPFGFWDSRKRTKWGRELTAIDVELGKIEEAANCRRMDWRRSGRTRQEEEEGRRIEGRREVVGTTETWKDDG
jgi:hypothetical protein